MKGYVLKKAPITWKHEFSSLIIFLLSWIRIRIIIPKADMDPATQNQCWFMRIRIHNTHYNYASTAVVKQ